MGTFKIPRCHECDCRSAVFPVVKTTGYFHCGVAGTDLVTRTGTQDEPMGKHGSLNRTKPGSDPMRHSGTSEITILQDQTKLEPYTTSYYIIPIWQMDHIAF